MRVRCSLFHFYICHEHLPWSSTWSHLENSPGRFSLSFALARSQHPSPLGVVSSLNLKNTEAREKWQKVSVFLPFMPSFRPATPHFHKTARQSLSDTWQINWSPHLHLFGRRNKSSTQWFASLRLHCIILAYITRAIDIDIHKIPQQQWHHIYTEHSKASPLHSQLTSACKQ